MSTIAPNSHLHGLKNVYVSGPMTGLPEFGYPAFRDETARLRGLGFTVYCPTERPGSNGEVFDPAGLTGTERLASVQFDPRAAFADYAAYITSKADAVVVLPGWRASRGAKAEVALGVAVGLPILDARTLEPVEANVQVVDDLEASMTRHPAGKTMQGRRPELTVVTEQVATQATSGEEVRLTSTTGGQKGVKEARYDLIPPGPLRELAVLYGRGSLKYAANNWKKGYDWSLSKGALERHLALFWMGEDHDEEMGVKHLICAAWHSINLAWLTENRPEFDDRPLSMGESATETYGGALPTPQWLLDRQHQA